MAVPWSAIAQGADSLAGGLFSVYNQNKANNANRDINAAQIEAARQNQLRDFEFQRDMWNATNEYNSPVNMANRYREAGINPYLAMQSGAGVSPAQMQAGDAGSVPGAIPMQSLGSYGGFFGDAVNTYLQLRKGSAEADMLEFQRDHQLDDWIAKIDELRSRTNLSRSQQQKLDFEYNYLTAVREDMISQQHYNALYTKEQFQQLRDYNSMQSLRVEAANIGLRLSRAQEMEIFQNIKESCARINHTISQMETEKVSRSKMHREIQVLIKDAAIKELQRLSGQKELNKI